MEQQNHAKQANIVPSKKLKKEQVEEDDDETIRKLLNDPTAFEGLESFGKGEKQEKADDAVDYEDFSDDELPDEEAPSAPSKQDNIEDDEDTADDGMEDLLFEGGNVQEDHGDDINNMKIDPDDLFGDVSLDDSGDAGWSGTTGLDTSMDEARDPVLKTLQPSETGKDRESKSKFWNLQYVETFN